MAEGLVLFFMGILPVACIPLIKFYLEENDLFEKRIMSALLPTSEFDLSYPGEIERLKTKTRLFRRLQMLERIRARHKPERDGSMDQILSERQDLAIENSSFEDSEEGVLADYLMKVKSNA